MNDLAALLDYKTPTTDLWPFIESAANGLDDPFQASSGAVAIVLGHFIKV